MSGIKGLPEQKQRVPDSRSLSIRMRHVLKWVTEKALESESDRREVNPSTVLQTVVFVYKIRITVIHENTCLTED